MSMMKDAQDAAALERGFWNVRADTLEHAKEAIAADESAWTGPILEACLEKILPALDAAPHGALGQRVLDLGCGAGRLTIPIAQRRPGFRMTGVDISQAMLNLAAVAEEGYDWPIRWLLCDGRTLPADIGRLDAAYSMITMQHIPRIAQEGYINQIAHLLVRGGVFRWQALEGTGASFLHHEVDETWLRDACTVAGLKITDLERTLPFNGTGEAKVLWITAVKK